MSDSARLRAAESVSARFSRIMNATTSRWGVLTDPSIIGVLTAPPVVALVAAVRLESSPSILLLLEVLAAAPLTVAVLVALALTRARGRVVDWLAGLPFPVENLNAVLNGLGESLEVTFEGDAPAVPELNVDLDKISAETFVTQSGPEGAPKPDVRRWVDVRIGVVDSKRNPAASNHERYVRVRDVVELALVPLAAKFPIAEVRVK
jgi:hypothetical protein